MKEQELEIRFKDLAGLNFARMCISNYLQSQLSDCYLQVEIALHEAVNNALLHGPANRFVTLRFAVINRKYLIMRVRNEGSGFDAQGLLRQKQALDDPDDDLLFATSGRGMFIMQAMTDKILYNQHGTEVMLIKRLPR